MKRNWVMGMGIGCVYFAGYAVERSLLVSILFAIVGIAVIKLEDVR